MAILQLKQLLPVETPKGNATVHFVIDYGAETDLLFVTFLDATGECWTYRANLVRLRGNPTMRPDADFGPELIADVGGKDAKPRIIQRGIDQLKSLGSIHYGNDSFVKEWLRWVAYKDVRSGAKMTASEMVDDVDALNQYTAEGACSELSSLRSLNYSRIRDPRADSDGKNTTQKVVPLRCARHSISVAERKCVHCGLSVKAIEAEMRDSGTRTIHTAKVVTGDVVRWVENCSELRFGWVQKKDGVNYHVSGLTDHPNASVRVLPDHAICVCMTA